MIEEVATNIYRVVVPLPMFAVGSMNSYIIKDPDISLIVDPGMAHSLCLEAMQAAMKELGVKPQETDFFMTHHHADHASLVSELMDIKSVIHIHRQEMVSMEGHVTGSGLGDMESFFQVMGFSEEGPERVFSLLVGSAMEYRASDMRASRAEEEKPFDTWPFSCVDEGHVFEKGGHRFRCMVTPGHSKAHTCLYEPDRHILMIGDELSPILQFVSGEDNPLGDLLISLERLYSMEIELVLPGHRSAFRDIKKRINQLRHYHQERTDEIMTALTKSPQTSFQLAAKIRTDMKNLEPWQALGLLDRFFLTRGCFAHLRSLEVKGLIRKEMRNRVAFYSLLG
ncbi:MAG: MBL fold metallo-hydrolase [Syntrophales bacterium]|nr:MBL fold metallo-hydrolase [Syntrophales bacterium]